MTPTATLRASSDLLLVLLLVAIAAAPAVAQGVVEGYVYEAETDTPLAGASVVLEGTARGAATDPDGFYRIEGVPPGTYRAVARLLGYAEDTQTVTVAGGTVRQDFTIRSTALDLEGVTVTGLRRGQVRSVIEKREALSVVDVVSADEIGQLPDLNVAESAQRVPGVTIRTDRGEGRFVSIRGTPPNRNNVTFNGAAVASAAGTRATALDLVPAEMVASIEVQKALTPDLDANALGGSVNVTTLTAFDRPSPFLSATLNGLAHQLTTEFGETRLPFRSSVTAGTRFGPDNAFGVVVAGTASRRDFNTAIVSPSAWVDVDGTPAPEEFEREVEDNDRFRYALNGNLDYRPAPATSAYVRAHYSLRDESFTNTEVQFEGGDVLPTSATTGRLEDVEVQLDIPTTDIDEELYATTIGLDQEFGPDVTVHVHGTFSRGTRTRRTFQPEWGEGQGFGLAYDVSGDFETLVFDDLEAVMDPTNYLYTEMDIEFEDLVEDTYQAGADLRYDVRFGENVGFVKVGGQFRLRDKDIDRNEDPWAAGDLPLDLSGFVMDPPDPLQGDGRVPVTGDVGRFLDFFDQNSAAGEYFNLDPVESAEEEVEVDAFVTEDVYAGYVMGNAVVGALTATGGVRVEATSTTSERFRFVNDDSFDNAQVSQLSAENSYVDVLPSAHLLFRISDRLQVRAAVSTTIGRPDYDELAAFQDVEFEEGDDGVFEGAIEQGNPDLEPLRALNLDATVELYRGAGSLFSVGAFYKRVRNPIYVFETTQRDVFGRDVDFQVDEIAGFGDRFFEEVTFQELRNADAGSVTGLEVSLLQLFDFLPAPFNGIGLSSNVAVMDSEVTVPGREDENVPFFGQSDVVLNVAPFYQAGPIELRAALNYQGAYLDAVSDDAFEDEYGDDRTTVDLYAGYKLLDRQVQFNAYVRNLTNEAEREYQGVRDRRTFHALTGRTFEFGVTVVL
ncbi:TonB-dependent receptor [Rubrivirga sp.]|uniref:TonB-dependent receptor n=1 Tax=Rubrivirga sp. TaxID=1885344 RepID=UPI003C7781F6